jgi:hypothetical protein
MIFFKKLKMLKKINIELNIFFNYIHNNSLFNTL